MAGAPPGSVAAPGWNEPRVGALLTYDQCLRSLSIAVVGSDVAMRAQGLIADVNGDLSRANGIRARYKAERAMIEASDSWTWRRIVQSPARLTT